MAQPSSPESVTALLRDVQAGRPDALDRLLPLVYAELRQIADRHMAAERAEHTLQPTALVHEAFLRLVGGSSPVSFNDRNHFLSAASRAMRHVLVDHARMRAAAKRGTHLLVTLDEPAIGIRAEALDMLVLDDALRRLADADVRCGQVVELRFFGGLDVSEIAAVLGVSSATVKRDWQFARAWLATELQDHHPT